jgi:hypothetical protein
MAMNSRILLSADMGDTSDKLPPKQVITNLRWLEGDWQNDSFRAIYSNSEGEMILSISKEFDKGDLVFYEFEKFEATDSSVILTPYPFGKKSVSFTLIDYNPDSTRAIFENKTHDFPTRISYELMSPDNLLILVSGVEDNKPITYRYDLKRKR